MAGKKVSFGTKPQKKPDVDAWVESREAAQETMPEEASLGISKASQEEANKLEEPKTQGAMKRLTLDIPADLHRRIKGKAVMEGVTMVNMLRELLEENYG